MPLTLSTMASGFVDKDRKKESLSVAGKIIKGRFDPILEHSNSHYRPGPSSRKVGVSSNGDNQVFRISLSISFSHQRIHALNYLMVAQNTVHAV